MAERILTVVKDFERLEECLNTSELDIFALNQFKALILQRIFTFNRTIDGSSFGTYRSQSYIEKRKAKGLEQLTKKNLQFTGELRDDLNLGVYQGKNALGFTGVERKNGKKTVSTIDIAEFQETSDKQIGKPIFAANQEEVDIVFEQFNEELDRIIAECLRV